MVLADLGRKITTALKSLGNATIINEDVSDLKCTVIQISYASHFIHFDYALCLIRTP